MKKLLLASLGLFLLGTGVAYAGGAGGCSYGIYKEKEMTQVQPATNAIVVIETKDRLVELADFTSKEKLYNVKTNDGNLLASNLTKEALSVQFPKLHDALEG